MAERPHCRLGPFCGRQA